MPIRVGISLGIGCLIFSLSTASCTKPPAAPAPPGLAAPPIKAAGEPSDARSFSGKVVETMNAASYTYVLVDTGTKQLWAAAQQFQVKVGDAITIEDGLPMRNYHSQTLNRDFDLVYFTGRALVGGVQTTTVSPAVTLPAGHPPTTGGAAPAAKLDLSGLKKAEGGQTIQEIFAAKAQLAGKPVTVRGKVVKFSAMIMGKNWIHLQDGTGTEGSNDLTLTTLSAAKVGSTVLATGTIAIDKDFGYGYKYSVLMEDAQLVVE